MAENDTEVTLGTGKLLGLFFVVVLVCALFFGLGYTIGKASEPGPAVAEGDAAAVPAPVVVKGGEKPSAAQKEEPQDAAKTTPAEDLTFFKSVAGEKEAEPKLEAPKEEKPAATAASRPAPELAGRYVVQVAAVTKQEDGEALVAALRKKQYPVFMLGITPTDKFYRIQVGPFAELKEAESMKARLSGDGYNPIIKK